MSTPMLALRGLRKSFGALVVTDNVHLEVARGELHALIGPNGAGKSCLINQITGELACDAGEVIFNGTPVNALSVHRRAQAGLARAYQVPRSFPNFSARGNVRMSEVARRRAGWRIGAVGPDDEPDRIAMEMLTRVGLADVADTRAADLAHGQKRQLELAMAFAARPSLLLLDEPLAGLGHGDSRGMVELMRSLKGEFAVLLVEHDVEAVFSLADRVSVLVAGKIIASGTPDEIRANTEVRSAYLGEEH